MSRPVIEAAPFSTTSAPAPQRGLSALARDLVGSRILGVAAEIRELKAKGAKINDFTVGDFSPEQFPIPLALVEGVQQALASGQTNYPPSDGLPDLKQGVQTFFKDRLGLSYPLDGILIASGARPVLFGAYSVLVDPDDAVLYPVPSWNNDAYSTMTRARAVAIPTRREHRFMPTADDIRPHLANAKLLVVNSPLNPAGTVIERADLAGLCEVILAENRRRAAIGKAPMYLIYDQIYWMLCFGSAQHVTPVEIAPEMAAYTIFVDGISKAFAATGLRVGWCVAPSDVIGKMKSFLGHVGAWAPRPEQVATARLLKDSSSIDSFHQTMIREMEARLGILHEGIQRLASKGFDVESIPPQGAIYLSVRISAAGRRRPDTHTLLQTNTDLRRYLLDAAGFAVVPFQAFGLEEDTGWFRLSVGAVSKKDCEDVIPRLEKALAALEAPRAAATA